MAKLKKRVKRKWLEALRSGKYAQGRRHLVDGDRFCCLGVLCDVAVKNGLNVEVVERPGGYKAFDGHSGTLPESVSGWAFVKGASTVDGDDPRVDLNGSRQWLSEVNDQGATFTEIADLIEEQL